MTADVTAATDAYRRYRRAGIPARIALDSVRRDAALDTLADEMDIDTDGGTFERSRTTREGENDKR